MHDWLCLRAAIQHQQATQLQALKLQQQQDQQQQASPGHQEHLSSNSSSLHQLGVEACWALCWVLQGAPWEALYWVERSQTPCLGECDMIMM